MPEPMTTASCRGSCTTSTGCLLPSRWWENSPLVVQEAFTHRRPVICSGIGGLAEKVDDEVNGLHFNVGDPDSLAWVIQRAATEPGLWERLRAGIPHVYTVDEHRREPHAGCTANCSRANEIRWEP